MEKNNLKDLSIKELKGKEKNLKLFMILFLPIIIGLFYYVFRDYFDGNKIDYSMLTIAICTISGPILMYPELKKVQKELNNRK